VNYKGQAIGNGRGWILRAQGAGHKGKIGYRELVIGYQVPDIVSQGGGDALKFLGSSRYGKKAIGKDDPSLKNLFYDSNVRAGGQSPNPPSSKKGEDV
jgi:hypothetical protein